MAVSAWILAGVTINDHIIPAEESCWKRSDLVNVPDIIKYTQTIQEESAIHFYVNNIGALVALIPYGKFNSFDEMNSDYYSEAPDSLYSSVYGGAVTNVNHLYQLKLTDFDWVMPVMEGDLQLQENFCIIPGIGTDSKAFVSLIDCSIIYTSIRQISDFVHFICNKKKLTKYQRWQLAYYQMSVQTIENPKVFLTNKEETAICSELYKKWQIEDNITALINNTNQAVTLFSFLSNYEENEENDLFSSFLTFFGIVVGLEAIYNLFAALFTNVNQWFKIIFVSIIAIVVIAFGAIFAQKAIKKHIEKTEFRRKTRK